MANGFNDYYEILEVHHKASSEIIKNAYRTLAKKYHPDTSGLSQAESTKKMALLNEAFDILSDSEKRAAYDRLWSVYHQISAEEPSATTNAQSQRPQYSSNEELSLSRIDSCCSTILAQLDELIERADNESAAAKNKKHCDRALAEFTKTVPYEMDGLKTSPEAYRIAETIVALTLWRLGTSYTWANEFKTAASLLNQALAYAKQSDDFFPRLKEAAQAVSKSAEKLKHAKDWRDSKLIVWGFIIAIGIYFQVFSGSSSKKPTATVTPTPSSSASVATPQTTQRPAPPAAAPVPAPVPLIPKANVVTQYLPNAPRLNSDGLCEITIDNTQNDYPVYVRIWNLDGKPKAVRSINVRQGDSFTAKSFSPGRYDIRYTRIYENEVASSASKSEPFELEQIQQKDGISYSTMSLTLYRVRHGNTRTSSIPMTEL